MKINLISNQMVNSGFLNINKNYAPKTNNVIAPAKDSFSFTAKEHNMTIDEAVELQLENYANEKEVRLKETNKKNQIEADYNQKIDSVNKKIKEMHDTDFGWEIIDILPDKEQMKLGRIIVEFAIADENGQGLPEDKVIEKTAKLIFRMIDSNPEYIEGDTRLENPEDDKKLQTLKNLYQEKNNLKAQQKRDIEKLSLIIGQEIMHLEKHEIPWKIKSNDIFKNKLRTVAMERNPDLKQIYKETYQEYCDKWIPRLRMQSQYNNIREFAVINANKKVDNFIFFGTDDLPF